MHTILVAFVTTYPKVQQTYGIGEGSSPSLRPKAHIDRDDKCREQKCFNEMECLSQHPPRAAMMRLLSPFRRRKHSLPRRPTIVSIQAVIRGGRRKKACSHPRTCIGSKPYKGGQWYKQAYHDFIETSPLIALESSSAIDSTVHSWFWEEGDYGICLFFVYFSQHTLLFYILIRLYSALLSRLWFRLFLE